MRDRKGYYSGANHKYLRSLEGLKECCLQQPGLDSHSLSEDDAETYARLVNRRAGIEPLIGHAKHGGQLGTSRMKQDAPPWPRAMAQLEASTCANFFGTYLEKTSRRWGE